MRKSFLTPFVLFLTCSLAALAEGLEQRLDRLEAKVDTLELSLDIFRGAGLDTPDGQPRKLRSKEELVDDLKIDDTGESRREDKLASFPEISTFVAWSSGSRGLVNGLGVELFHDRNKPRRHSWMFKLLLGDEWVGFSAGYILVPVINFNVGPFIALDLHTDLLNRDKKTVVGLQASVFSF